MALRQGSFTGGFMVRLRQVGAVGLLLWLLSHAEVRTGDDFGVELGFSMRDAVKVEITIPTPWEQSAANTTRLRSIITNSQIANLGETIDLALERDERSSSGQLRWYNEFGGFEERHNRARAISDEVDTERRFGHIDEVKTEEVSSIASGEHRDNEMNEIEFPDYFGEPKRGEPPKSAGKGSIHERKFEPDLTERQPGRDLHPRELGEVGDD